MKAIRVRKRTKGGIAAHWLTDADGTKCGLDVERLDVLEELELAKLPPLEACIGCQRIVDRIPQVNAARDDDAPSFYRHALPASYGRSSGSGKLRQTGASGHGHRLRP